MRGCNDLIGKARLPQAPPNNANLHNADLLQPMDDIC